MIFKDTPIFNELVIKSGPVRKTIPASVFMKAVHLSHGQVLAVEDRNSVLSKPYCKAVALNQKLQPPSPPPPPPLKKKLKH